MAELALFAEIPRPRSRVLVKIYIRLYERRATPPRLGGLEIFPYKRTLRGLAVWHSYRRAINSVHTTKFVLASIFLDNFSF